MQLDAAVRGQVAEALAQALAEHYVYEEIGREMAEAIRNRLQEGAYDGIRSPVEFADALQVDLREISRDGHLGVRYEPMSPAPRAAVPGPAVPLLRDAGPMAPGLTAPDPAARAGMELLAEAKLSGEPDLEFAALEGEYAPVQGGGPGMPAAIRR